MSRYRSEIDWNTVRGAAFEDARAEPGTVRKYQAEDGLMQVSYHDPLPSATLFGVEIAPGRPGYWYEVAVRDNTKIFEDSAIGIRIIDADEDGKDES